MTLDLVTHTIRRFFLRRFGDYVVLLRLVIFVNLSFLSEVAAMVLMSYRYLLPVLPMSPEDLKLITWSS